DAGGSESRAVRAGEHPAGADAGAEPALPGVANALPGTARRHHLARRHLARLRVPCLRRGAWSVGDFPDGAGSLRCHSLCRRRLSAVARLGRVAARRAGRVRAARATGGFAMAALPHGPRDQHAESESGDVLSGIVSSIHRCQSRQRAGPGLGAGASANSDQLGERSRFRPRRRCDHWLACQAPTVVGGAALGARRRPGRHRGAARLRLAAIGGPSMQLSDSQQMVRETMRNFAQQRLAPFAAAWDREHAFPRDALRELAALGACGIVVPESYGGAGLDYVSLALALEEIAAGDGATSTVISVQNSVVCGPIFAFGTAAQKDRYLKPLASGAKIGCFCLTEPHTGSDAAAIATRAEFVRAGDDDGGGHY